MIPLTKDFQIVIDERCYILQQRKVVGESEKHASRIVREDRRGEIMWVNLSYHMDIEQALKRFNHVELSRCKNLQEIRTKLAELREIALGIKRELEPVQ
jgi:hypothetical protein